jgi:cytidylate kinase
MTGEPMIVAIDGPAAAGKGTLARRIAAHFNFAYLDSGLLYRAVGLRLLRRGGDPADPDEATEAARGISAADLDDPELRGDTAAAAASKAAAIPSVRAALLDFQRDFAAHPPKRANGAVLDGRDIGTVVCPGAQHKLFVIASPDVRAERRLKELRERGVETIHSRVLREMRERDARDRDRAVAPLVQAEDAVLLDTTGLDQDAVFAVALEIIASGNPNIGG